MFLLIGVLDVNGWPPSLDGFWTHLSLFTKRLILKSFHRKFLWNLVSVFLLIGVLDMNGGPPSFDGFWTHLSLFT